MDPQAGDGVNGLLGAIIDYLSNPATYEGRFALQNLLVEHVYFVVISTLIAAAIAIPVGLWVGHRGRGELGVVAAANTGRAIPDFGIILIALLILGLGRAPTIIALVGLAIPAMLINTYVGIRQVDPEVRDAAFGSGMTGRQVLAQVELPVAVPLIMTGVRTAAVQVVATATLAGVVGGGGLGRIMFDGFAAGVRRGDPPPGLARVVVASILVAILAIVTELALGRLERALTPRGIRRADEAMLEEQPDPEHPELTTRAAA